MPRRREPVFYDAPEYPRRPRRSKEQIAADKAAKAEERAAIKAMKADIKAQLKAFKNAQKEFKKISKNNARIITNSSMPFIPNPPRPASYRRSGLPRNPRRTKEEIAADKAMRAEQVAINKEMRALAKAQREVEKQALKDAKKRIRENARAMRRG